MNNKTIVPGTLYGTLAPIHPVRRLVNKRSSERWKCGCRNCHATHTLTPNKVKKGVCPECHAPNHFLQEII